MRERDAKICKGKQDSKVEALNNLNTVDVSCFFLLYQYVHHIQKRTVKSSSFK